MKKYLAAVAALIALLATAACGSADSSASRSGDHNQQDVMFAVMMIPHHQQAVEMAEMVEDRGAGTELAQLAKNIKTAQQPEIDKMTGWLKAWDENVPSSGSAMGDHAGHAGMGGMMTDEQMGQLDAAAGPAFEQLWLEMMIEHHEGAIDMAKAQKSGGQYPAALSMADDIIGGQEKEIAQMKKMLGQ
ncbi:DUF305 domain-containing protein [Cumulibacter manganitolerans]|uniref:DUF305 domain-containing protein n=1 Tax=Cumulibacter manganitolerans TaxID=1884992 RepID=UPI001294A93F|nr:DUF305 domain-containing protein [Cumulibacter manganitolerans]